MTIDDLLAREAIRDTLAKYNASGDRSRTEDYAACFTRDGIIESSDRSGGKGIYYEGRDAILALKANQYDMVCNGYELASGSIRNHLPDVMVKAFEITGLGQADVEGNFGALYRAFQYGAPPHGGMAAGIERMVMLLTGTKTVRDVALFPMNQQASDLLMGAPSDVSPSQLRELNIRLAPVEKK